METCSEQSAEFRSTFGGRSPDDQRTLEFLTSWAVRLCRDGVVELTYQVSPQERDRYLELAPPGDPALLHVVNSSKVNVYSYAYANLGRERLLRERLGGSPAADDALRQAEELAQGRALWVTEFTPATLETLERLLR